MGGRGASYSLSGSGTESRMTKASKGKLDRLQAEFNQLLGQHFEDTRSRQGEPWHLENAKGRANFRRNEKQMDRLASLQSQIEKQKRIVDRAVAKDNARGSLFDYKGNLNITAKNYKQVKSYLKDIESGKIKSGRTRATERAWAKKLASIEKSVKSSKSVKISSSAKRLIDSGKVTQWSKNPNIYFVKGLRKTALEMQPNGSFKVSPRYSGNATTKHQEALKNFIKTGEVTW